MSHFSKWGQNGKLHSNKLAKIKNVGNFSSVDSSKLQFWILKLGKVKTCSFCTNEMTLNSNN